MAQQSPDQAYLRWPMTAITAFLILCAQVVIVSIWRMLGLVQHDRIFSVAAFVWVDAIAVVGLLVVVMRGLLHQTTTLHTDMEAVI